MQSHDETPRYRVWGDDNIGYGPVELTGLVDWIKESRVHSANWIFLEPARVWRKAADIPELQMFFAQTPGSASQQPTIASLGLKPNSLRRIKIFASMPEQHLGSFLNYMEPRRVRPFSYVVRKGDHGDAVYFVLEGELRAISIIDGKESVLTTMEAGDFFGEISLLDQGPRSVDVVANVESIILKLSADSFEKLVREAPALATPFLFALSRSVVGRVRSLTKRYEDSIHISRTLGEV